MSLLPSPADACTVSGPSSLAQSCFNATALLVQTWYSSVSCSGPANYSQVVNLDPARGAAAAACSPFNGMYQQLACTVGAWSPYVPSSGAYAYQQVYQNATSPTCDTSARGTTATTFTLDACVSLGSAQGNSSM